MPTRNLNPKMQVRHPKCSVELLVHLGLQQSGLSGYETTGVYQISVRGGSMEEKYDLLLSEAVLAAELSLSEFTVLAFHMLYVRSVR